MAESVVCFVIDKLMSVLITTEAKLSRDVRAEVGFLRDELESIRSFLKDADAAAAAAEGDMVTDKNESTLKPITRRLLIDSTPYDALGIIEQSRIRSLFTFNQEQWPESFLSTLSGNFKLMKILDFADAPLNHLPKYVGDLHLLKYLSLRNTKVKLLPESICNLQNLETLDLKQSLVYEIPAKINKLLKLRHLLAHYTDSSTDFSMISYERGVKVHDGIGCLQALQKLYHVETNHGGINLIKALKKLRQLRKLGLKNLKREYGQALWASREVAKLDSKASTTCQATNFLVKLGFSYNAYDGVQLHFEGGFKELRVLKLKHLPRLNSLIIDNGAMPLLRELHIGPSPQLKEVPSGIQHLKNLSSLRFVDMPKEFRQHMDPNNGQHYWIVEHIQDVLFMYKFGPRCGVFETHALRDSNL
ncbi:unnamed protein product [Malus baccata var. baccata]